MNKLCKMLLTISIVFFPSLGLASKVVIRDYSTSIVGDFGPRRIIDDGVSKCDFHKGLDLKGVSGDAFPLVENGTVNYLGFTQNGGAKSGIFYARVDGDKKYRYMHMFSNVTVTASNLLPINSGNFTLAQTTESKAYAIIYWTNKVEKRAKYIISDIAGQTVKIGDRIIRKEVGDEFAETTDNVSVVDNPYIGPIGTSGNFPSHMHIDMGLNVNVNPLNYITHENAVAYEMGLWDKNNKTRDESWVISDKIADSYYLKITVTSKETLNLDKVLIYVDSAAEKNLLREYSYGGRAGENPLNTLVENGDCSDGLKDGVYSVDLDGNGESDVGNERFIFSKWADSKDVKTHLKIENLSAGNHSLIIRKLLKMQLVMKVIHSFI